MELEALFDAVIVKPIEAEESTYGSIIVPDLGKEKNETGTVIAVGPGKYTITGEFIKTQRKEGDKVSVEDVIAETKVSEEEINQLKDISNE